MAKEDKTMSVILTHDVWDNDGNRIAAGPDAVDLPVKIAKQMVNAGKATLPEDD